MANNNPTEMAESFILSVFVLVYCLSTRGSSLDCFVLVACASLACLSAFPRSQAGDEGKKTDTNKKQIDGRPKHQRSFSFRLLRSKLISGANSWSSFQLDGVRDGGAAVGSVLVPLVLTSFRDTMVLLSNNRDEDFPFMLSLYVRVASLTGLLFASLYFLRSVSKIYDNCGNNSGAFTRGEAQLVGTVLTILVVDFFIRFVAPQMIFARLGGLELWYSPPSLPPHLAAAEGGFSGCVLGCLFVHKILSSSGSLPSSGSVQNGSRQEPHQDDANYIGNRHVLGRFPYDFFLSALQTAPIRLIIVTVFAIGCAEIAVLRSFGDLGTSRGQPKIEVEWSRNLPVCIQWLISFVLSPSDDFIATEPIHANHNTDYGQWIKTTARTLPRWMWFAYWATALACFVPPALFMAFKLQSTESSPTKTETKSCKALHQIKSNHGTTVVMARKYFHLVAVVLFGPPTLLSPSLMALAYAVATALLILVEVLRLGTSRNPSPLESSGQNVKSEKSRKDMVEIKGLMGPLNSFFEAFMDDKDKNGGNGFIITHIALVCGCGAPLWIYEGLLCSSCRHQCSIILQHENNLCFADSHQQNLLQTILHSTQILPFIGIIVLGVGDALAAVVGISVGHTKWPQSNRTVEGSLAMFLGMFLCVISLEAFFYGSSFMDAVQTSIGLSWILASLAILEAFLTQVDNIVLPLAGASLLLIHGVYCFQQQPAQ